MSTWIDTDDVGNLYRFRCLRADWPTPTFVLNLSIYLLVTRWEGTKVTFGEGEESE